jgi:hypothetical protein
MFGLTKYQVAELLIFIVVVYHLRKVYEATVPGASQLLTMAPKAVSETPNA